MQNISDSTPQVKILSGWSNPGGSTIAFINLTNLFNSSGINCTFYGPNDWHLDKCKSGKIENYIPDEKDILISHFCQLDRKSIAFSKHILSCHETNLFPLNTINFKQYDFIHFVSNLQKRYHSINWPSVIIPNVISFISKSTCTEKIAGVIGSIDSHKQTHLSIRRALEDGYKKILVYGNPTDPNYFNAEIAPLISDIVNLMGHEDDKQKMYNSISAVYNSSIRETFNYIKQEAILADIEYNGLKSTESLAVIMSNEEILSLWKEYL